MAPYYEQLEYFCLRLAQTYLKTSRSEPGESDDEDASLEDESDDLEGEDFEEDGAEGEGERHREQPRVEDSLTGQWLHV